MTPTDKSGFPGGSAGKESTCNAGILGSISELGKSPGEGKVFWPGEFHELCSPWGHKELDMTERLPLPLSQTSYPTALYPGDGLSKADPPVSFYTHTHTRPGTTGCHGISLYQTHSLTSTQTHTALTFGDRLSYLLDYLHSEEIPKFFPSSVSNLVSVSGSTAPLEISGCHRTRSSGRGHSRRSALPGREANPCQTLLTRLTYGDVNIHSRTP